MSATIEILPQLVADQIAAGEVVERPASVVKELLDNAIDAGAKNVTLRIEGSGVELVEVQDDGHGMTVADAGLATRRHATSKLRVLSDLGSLDTMGFRGEALASIAAVSKLEIITRTRDALEGARVTAEGGREVTVTPTGAPVGTLVRVRDLFFNVPARRKFLKSKANENQVISAVVRRTALAHPDLRIRLLRDGREALAFLPVRDAGEHLKQCFPKDSFTRIAQTQRNVQLLGWLGTLDHARAGNTHLYLFVNQRPIIDRALQKAIGDGYQGALPPGKTPCGAIFLTVPPQQVDINVHPQKAEVRFADELGVGPALTSMVASHHYRQQLSEGPTAALRSTFARPPDYWEERLGGARRAGVRDSAGASPPVGGATRKGVTPSLRPGGVFGTATVSAARRVPSPRAEPPQRRESDRGVGEPALADAAKTSEDGRAPTVAPPAELALAPSVGSRKEPKPRAGERAARRLERAAVCDWLDARALDEAAGGRPEAAAALRAAARDLRAMD